MAEAEVALRLPMALDSTGNLLTTDLEDQIWADRVKIALGTRLGERVMRPGYGSKIGNSLFSTVSSMQETVRREVTKIFSELFPLLEIGDMEFAFNELTGRLNISINYTLPNKKESRAVVGVMTISDTNPPYEELR